MNLRTPHGFEFGISKKDALNLIESSKLKVISDREYSNDLRKVVLDGSLSGVALDPPPDHETRLEFYKDNLMSSSILFSFEDENRFAFAKANLSVISLIFSATLSSGRKCSLTRFCRGIFRTQ